MPRHLILQLAYRTKIAGGTPGLLTVEEDRRGGLAAATQQGCNDLDDAHVEVGDVEQLGVVQQVDALHCDGDVDLLQQLAATILGGVEAGGEGALAQDGEDNRADDGVAVASVVEALVVRAVVGAGATWLKER
jgi:hypothetical protein